MSGQFLSSEIPRNLRRRLSASQLRQGPDDQQQLDALIQSYDRSQQQQKQPKTKYQKDVYVTDQIVEKPTIVLPTKTTHILSQRQAILKQKRGKAELKNLRRKIEKNEIASNAAAIFAKRIAEASNEPKLKKILQRHLSAGQLTLRQQQELAEKLPIFIFSDISSDDETGSEVEGIRTPNLKPLRRHSECLELLRHQSNSKHELDIWNTYKDVILPPKSTSSNEIVMLNHMKTEISWDDVSEKAKKLLSPEVLSGTRPKVVLKTDLSVKSLSPNLRHDIFQIEQPVPDRGYRKDKQKKIVQPPSAFSKVREAVPKDYERQRMKDAKAEKVRQMKKDLSLPLETIKLFSEEDKKPLMYDDGSIPSPTNSMSNCPSCLALNAEEFQSGCCSESNVKPPQTALVQIEKRVEQMVENTCLCDQSSSSPSEEDYVVIQLGNLDRLVSEPNISYNPSGPNQDSSKFETSIVIGRVDPAAWLATVNDTIKSKKRQSQSEPDILSQGRRKFSKKEGICSVCTKSYTCSKCPQTPYPDIRIRKGEMKQLKSRPDSFTCQSLPNLIDQKPVSNKIWGQFQFVSRCTSTATGISSKDGIASSYKTISFQDFSNPENLPDNKHVKDDDDDCDVCLCMVLVIGTLILVTAVAFTIGLLMINFASQMLFPDPAIYEIKSTPPLFPIASIHERIFAKNKELPIGIK